MARPLMPRTPLESPALACCVLGDDAGLGHATEPVRGSKEGRTDNVDLLAGNQADTGGATRNLFLIFGVWSRKSVKGLVREPEQQRAGHVRAHTVEDGTVGCEESVLKALCVVASLEGILLKDDVVDVLAGE